MLLLYYCLCYYSITVCADTQSEAAWRLEIRGLLDALLKQQTQATVQQGFSKGWADWVLASLEIVECVGNELDPIVVGASAPVARAFDFSHYGNENAGNLDLLQHHQAELVKFGVKFGRNAFTMFDLHEHRDLYPIVHDGQEYCGDLDGGIAPFGLSAGSAAYQLRVAYKHKQSGAQKQRYRERHGEMAQVLSHVIYKHAHLLCWVQQNNAPRCYMLMCTSHMCNVEVDCQA